MASPTSPDPPSPWAAIWLRRVDQLAVAVLTLLCLVAMAAYGLRQGLQRGELIEIDRVTAETATFQVDLNQATWPELAELPEVGETLARRIVASREAEGPFTSHAELKRVSGIGPIKLQRITPYLLPLSPAQALAEQSPPP